MNVMKRTAFASLVGLSSLFAYGQDDAPQKGQFEQITTLAPRMLYGAEEVYRASGAEFKNYELSGWRIDRRSGNLTTGAYQAGANLSAVGGEFSVPSVKNDERVYLHISDEFQIESNYDSGKLKLSTDGSATWQTVYTASGATDLRTAQVNITRFAGKTVQLALELHSDASTQGAGWTVNEIVVTKGNRKPVATTKVGARGLADNEIKITAVHDDNFPEAVYVDFEYTESGIHNVDKTISDFVFEYGGDHSKCQPSLYKASTTTKRDVDLVFLMDNSGSMDYIQADVIAHTQAFIQNLPEVANVNFAMIRLGIDLTPNQGIAPMVTTEWFDDNGIATPFTSDVDYFNEQMDIRNHANGWTERSYEAVKLASSLTFRANSQKIFILVCNADIQETTPLEAGGYVSNLGETQLQEAVDMANNVGASIYSYIPNLTTFDDDLALLASETGGERIELTSTPDFSVVTDAIEDAILGTYTLRFCPSRIDYDGQIRKVAITKSDNPLATDEASFIPDLNQEYIVRNENTVLQSKVPVEAEESFEVCFDVIDNVSPFAETVDLHFKTLGSSLSFETVSMQFDGVTTQIERTWCADISAPAVLYPGVEYYAVASYADGHELKSPPVHADFFAWTQAVMPNYPPSFNITLNTSSPESCQTYTFPEIRIEDNTQSVSAATLWYKDKFALNWSSVDLAPYAIGVGTASMVASNVPIEIIGDATLYFIQATDNFGTIGEYGTEDNPYELTSIQYTGISGAEPATKIDFSAINFQCNTGLLAGDVLSAYASNGCGSLRLCGQLEYDGTGDQIVQALGNDISTSAKDGLDLLEPIKFEITRNGITYQLTKQPNIFHYPLIPWGYTATEHPSVDKTVKYGNVIISANDNSPTSAKGTYFESFNGAGAITHTITAVALSCNALQGFGNVTVQDDINFTVNWNGAPNLEVTYNGLANAYSRVRIESVDGNDFYFDVNGVTDPCQATEIRFGSAIVANGDVTPSTIDGTDFGAVQQATEHAFVLESNCFTKIEFVASDNAQFNAYKLSDTELRVAYLAEITADAEVAVTLSDGIVYTFVVSGESLVCNWGVNFGSESLINGDFTPSYDDGTNFGMQQDPETHTFTLSQSNCSPNISIIDAHTVGTEFSVSHTSASVDVTYSANDDETSEVVVETTDGDFTFTVKGQAQDGTPVQSTPRFAVPVPFNIGYLDFNITFSGNTCNVSADVVNVSTGITIATGSVQQINQYWAVYGVNVPNLSPGTYTVSITIEEECQNCTVTETHTITVQ